MSITKSLFTVGIAVVFGLGALSCSDTGTGPIPGSGTDAQAVAADKSALAITYSAGDSAGWVTSNIGLPASGSNGSSISWVTSASSRITTEGVVSRPAAGNGDASVTLTATISKGTASDVKVFALTVKNSTIPAGTDAQIVASVKGALTITYSGTDNAGSVTSNVVLPTSGSNGSSISWTTSNSSRISSSGVVSRPAAGNGDAVVTLTATISKGTASDVKVFTLSVKVGTGGGTGTDGTMTDIDGNVYTTVKIGTQEWTVENLRVTKYNDGTVIPLVTDSAAWARIYYNDLTTPAYCFYKNTTNADSIKKYGALYNWYVVNTKKLAPAGWHVPSDSEWTIMEKYLVKNGYNRDGTTDTTAYNRIAKALAAKTGWSSSSTTGNIGCDLTKNNRSGFSALPGGSRSSDGDFFSQSYYGLWWSATESAASHAYNRGLYYDIDYLSRGYSNESCGFSVRLLRDN